MNDQISQVRATTFSRRGGRFFQLVLQFISAWLELKNNVKISTLWSKLSQKSSNFANWEVKLCGKLTIFITLLCVKKMQG